jgi:hypothetical protein
MTYKKILNEGTAYIYIFTRVILPFPINNLIPNILINMKKEYEILNKRTLNKSIKH